MMTRAPKLKAPMRRPGSCAMTPRIVNGWPPIMQPIADAHAELHQELRADERATTGEEVVRVGTTVGQRQRAVEREPVAATARSSTMRATAMPCSARTIVGVSIDSVSRHDRRVGQNRVDLGPHLGRPGAIGLDDDVGGDHRARFARQAVPQTLDDRPESDDGADADGHAQKEEQEPSPGGAEFAQRHADDEEHVSRRSGVGSRESQSAVTSSVRVVSHSRQSRVVSPNRQSQSSVGEVGSVCSPAVLSVTCTTRPSRSEIVRSAMAAISGSWVTRTRVGLRERWIWSSRSMTCRPVVLSRLPVGSSASRIGGSFGERARDGDALLFAARELRRIVMATAGQADFGEQRLRPSRRVGRAGDLHRDEHVLERGERWQQMEELKDEPDSSCHAGAPARPR